MKPRIHNGYLVIADITGFTSFLAETELDHAQVILQQILDSEEEHVDWLETQLGLIDKLGIENYNQTQIGEVDG